MSNICKHVMKNITDRGAREEVTILENTAMGFKEMPGDKLVKSLWWEQAHNKIMIATK